MPITTKHQPAQFGMPEAVRMYVDQQMIRAEDGKCYIHLEIEDCRMLLSELAGHVCALAARRPPFKSPGGDDKVGPVLGYTAPKYVLVAHAEEDTPCSKCGAVHRAFQVVQHAETGKEAWLCQACSDKFQRMCGLKTRELR